MKIEAYPLLFCYHSHHCAWVYAIQERFNQRLLDFKVPRQEKADWPRYPVCLTVILKVRFTSLILLVNATYQNLWWRSRQNYYSLFNSLGDIESNHQLMSSVIYYLIAHCTSTCTNKPRNKDSQTRSCLGFFYTQKQAPGPKIRNTGSQNCGTGCEIAPGSHLIF